MTTQELKERYLGSSFKGRGHFRVGFIFRNKKYYSITTNILAIDRIDDELPQPEDYYTTQKQALLSLYNEVKRANDLH